MSRTLISGPAPFSGFVQTRNAMMVMFLKIARFTEVGICLE